jgi:hypothetical protein
MTVAAATRSVNATRFGNPHLSLKALRADGYTIPANALNEWQSPWATTCRGLFGHLDGHGWHVLVCRTQWSVLWNNYSGVGPFNGDLEVTESFHLWVVGGRMVWEWSNLRLIRVVDESY